MWNITSIDEANTYFSDVYKDANGFRPRFDTSEWTLEKWNKEFNYLQNSINEQIAREDEYKSIATADFKKRIEDCKKLGASDDITAVRWILEGDKVDLNDYYSYDHWLYDNKFEHTFSRYVGDIVMHLVEIKAVA